jgi:hypothetical protein
MSTVEPTTAPKPPAPEELTPNQALALLLPDLRRLVDQLEIQREQSSQSIALSRGKQNNQLYSGTLIFSGAAGAWHKNLDFVVPFARIFYIDSAGDGPFTFSTDRTGAQLGVGTYNSFTAGGDSANVPLSGNALSITSASSSSTAPTLFVAVFTDLGPIIAS